MNEADKSNQSNDQLTPSNQTRVGHGRAHSKIILMGEHAVVYDYPAIALPFPAAHVDVTITNEGNSCSTVDSDYFTGRLSKVPKSMANIKKAIGLALDSFQETEDHLHYQVKSNIPIGRGMGSSAAIAVAIVRAICDYYDQTISTYQLHLIVNQAEVIAHESTSGLDTLMTSTDSPVIYRKSQPPFSFDFSLDAHLIVADSGLEGQTKLAVSKVRQLKERKPKFIKSALETIGSYVEQAYDAILEGDITELGRLMTYNHYYLNQLQISSPILDRIINAAWLAGALGAKLTGGGLGGCVIALADSPQSAKDIQNAMQEAGAVTTWSLSLNS